MKNKILLAVIAAMLAVLLVCAFVACNPDSVEQNGGKDETHPLPLLLTRKAAVTLRI